MRRCASVRPCTDPTQFRHFVDICEKIRAATSKNLKVDILSDYLLSLDDDDESLTIAVLFFSGRIFPPGPGFVMNLGFSTILQALSEIATLDSTQIQKIYLQHGDLGALSEYAVSKKNMTSLFQQQPLTLLSIYGRLKRIADTIGSGSGKDKKNILKGLLIDSSPIEAKYVIKIITGDMRIGLTEGLVEIAISKVFQQNLKYVRDAMLVSGDISQVAVLAKRDMLHTALIKPLTPMSYMLADVMFSAKEIVEYYQKALICEFKYDGIRAQLHKFGHQIRLFSRKLSDVTKTFPELANAAAHTIMVSSSSTSESFILDGEVMAFQNDKPLHFQELQKRLHKKNLSEQLMTEIPLAYVVFDIMYINGESLIEKSIKERKEILSGISFKKPIINSTYRLASLEEEIIGMFGQSREIGHEGLVLKDPNSHYHPGKRGRYWVKLKRELDTIDAVIVIAEYGHGRRAGVLSDYTFAVKDDDNNNNDTSTLRTIGKAYSGLTDTEILDMTKRLKSIMIRDEGIRIIVKPEIVIEVAFDSLQKSNRHDSGFALRFPRIKNIREDKNISDIDSLQKVKEIFQKQTHTASNIGNSTS
ncbi:MAG TPA: ATP-dependent DNA ligase [Nitrososphaeraceae archaeon]|nr:ATP-dependent DNA ligase [Nitrososphaeraceae archaeon]